MNKLAKFFVGILIVADLMFFSAAFISHRMNKEIKPVPVQIELKTKPAPTESTNLTEEQLIERQIVNCTIQIGSANGTGTGVVIANDTKKDIAYIITACHVVGNEKQIAGRQENGDDWIVEDLTTISTDIDNDIAILSSKASWKATAIMPTEGLTIQRFKQIFTYGFIGGASHTGILSSGYVADIHNFQFAFQERMITSAPVIFGNSGGGMFIKVGNDYVLVGIATGVHFMLHNNMKVIVTHVSIACTKEEMLDFVKETFKKSNK